MLSARVPKAVADKVNRLCEERGATVNEVLGELVAEWLAGVVRDAAETVRERTIQPTGVRERVLRRDTVRREIERVVKQRTIERRPK